MLVPSISDEKRTKFRAPNSLSVLAAYQTKGLHHIAPSPCEAEYQADDHGKVSLVDIAGPKMVGSAR